MEIRELNELLENCEENKQAFVYARDIDDKHYQRYRIKRCSIHNRKLSIYIDRQNTDSIKLESFKGYTDNCEVDYIVDVWMDRPEILDHRGTDIDSGTIVEGNLILYSVFFPRSV